VSNSQSFIFCFYPSKREVNFTKTYRKESAFCINVDDYQKLKDEMFRLTKGTNTSIQLINCTWHREREKDVAASKVTLKTPLHNLIDSRSPIGCKHCSSNFTNAKNSSGKRQLKDFFPIFKNAFMKGVCDRLIIVPWAERDMKFIAKIQINYFEGS
uniref:Uncharacterized protein n=1 Tax=Echinococcus canadensis TaxID=519352 RepID=A0A915EYL9_9CEST